MHGKHFIVVPEIVFVNFLEISTSQYYAGLSSPGTIEESPLSNYDNVMRVNARAPYQLTQLALPHLRKTKGNIVNMSSVVSARAVRTENDFFTTVLINLPIQKASFLIIYFVNWCSEGYQQYYGHDFFHLFSLVFQFVNYASYSMSKAALDNLTWSASHENAKYGVRVNAVNPGYIPTKINRRGTLTDQEIYEVG